MHQCFVIVDMRAEGPEINKEMKKYQQIADKPEISTLMMQ